MTYIQNIPDGPRERLREEIFRNLAQRREDAQNALAELCKYMGIVLSGGTIAILSFIASRRDQPIPILSVCSLLLFVISILSFSVMLYLHYSLQNSRWNLYADAADKFFTRNASLEDVMGVPALGRSKWLYRLLFWIPFGFMALGFLCGAGAAFTLITCNGE